MIFIGKQRCKAIITDLRIPSTDNLRKLEIHKCSKSKKNLALEKKNGIVLILPILISLERMISKLLSVYLQDIGISLKIAA